MTMKRLYDQKYGTETISRLLEPPSSGQWQDRGAKLLHTVSRYPQPSVNDELIYNDYHNDDCPRCVVLPLVHIPDPIRFPFQPEGDRSANRVGHRGLFERQMMWVLLPTGTRRGHTPISAITQRRGTLAALTSSRHSSPSRIPETRDALASQLFDVQHIFFKTLA